MRRLTTCVAALALVLAGCGDDDTATDDTATTDASATSAPEDTTTSASEGTPSERRCTSPDGFSIGYPEHWEAVSDCGQFGPGPIEEPTPSSDDRTGVVSAYVDPVAFDQVSQPDDVDRDREEGTVDAHPAVRVESVLDGTGLYPEGTESVRWMVDLGDEGTLFLDAYDLFDDVDFDEAVDVLDHMVQSVEIEDR